jgi:predicted PurR-regulated permease PerM
MITQIHPNKIRQILFLIVLLLLFVLITRELNFLLIPSLGAITFYVLLRNWMLQLVLKYKWKKSIAALVIITGTLILIIAPFAWLIQFGYHRLSPIIANPDVIQQKFVLITNYIQQKFNINIISEQYTQKINSFLLSSGKSALGGALGSVGSLLLSFFILYFMLVQTGDVEKSLRNYLPFKHKNVQNLINKSRGLVFSNAIGIPIVAIIQGLVGMIGYWIFGADEFLLFGLLTALVSVVPVIGTILVWVPLMLYMLAIGQTNHGIGIGLWGFLVIGSVDNVVRFLVQKKLSNVHPLVTIFGVVMGVNLFGFLGIIFGPILLSLFVLLIQIYVDEYGIVDANDVE